MSVWFLAVPRGCLEGFATPRFTYVPYEGLHGLARAAAACGPVRLHVVGVGRFAIDADLRARPAALLGEVGWMRLEGPVPPSQLLPAIWRLRARRGLLYAYGDPARLDDLRFARGLPLSFAVGGTWF